MSKNHFETISFLEKILKITGWLYPFLVIFLVQLISTPLFVVLTMLPANANAQFTEFQNNRLIVVGLVGLLVRNIFMMIIFYYSNRAVIVGLSEMKQSKYPENNSEIEKKRWKQATSASKKLIFLEFIGLITLVLIPVLIYGFYQLDLRIDQLIHLGLACVASGLVVLLLESMTIDQLFEPILKAIIPRHFEDQIHGINGMFIWKKLSLLLIGLVLICLILVIPASYEQAKVIYLSNSKSPNLLSDTIWVLLRAGFGGVFVGIFLSACIVTYFSRPFNKMIRLFKKIEEGDLS